MAKIWIDETDNGNGRMYEDEWKEWVCCDFDQNVVIYGNRRMGGVTEADWWNDAMDLMKDFDFYNFDDIVEIHTDLTRETLLKVEHIYNCCRTYEDIDVMAEVIRTIHPELEIETTTLRGYSQSDWNDAVCIKGSVDENLLNDFYWGNINRVTISEDEDDEGEYIYYLADSELWEMERKGLRKEIMDRYGIYDDCQPVHIYKADGYIKALNWKEVV
jgi:hypothetical protein